jgi:cytochrome c peroxidase
VSNPAALAHALDAHERRGAELFRDKCASCHAARLSTDDPRSAVAFERWPGLLASPADPLVWASPEYRKVGILPYVCELGTRTPSLRRVARKWPHFTNGSAATLADVLSAVRFDGARFFHGSPPADTALHTLDAEEQRALAAFLELL